MYRFKSYLLGFVANNATIALLSFAIIAPASAGQLVFIDFEAKTTKGNKDIFDPHDKTKKIATLKEGTGSKFDVTNIGFDADESGDVKDALVKQVKDAFAMFPWIEIKSSQDTRLEELAGKKFTVIDVVSGITSAQAEATIGGQTITFPVVDDETAGMSQKFDTGNMDKMDAAWVFADNLNLFTEKEKNRNEVGNTISHELGHLLGLKHRHGEKGEEGKPDSIMFEDSQKGVIESFSRKAKTQLKKAWGVVHPQRVPKKGQSGDTDRGGERKRLDPDSSIEQSATQNEKEETLERLLNLLVDEPPADVQSISEWSLQEINDDPNTDTLISNGSFFYDLTFNDPLGLIENFFLEIGHYNIEDDPLDPSDDIRVFISDIREPSGFMEIPNFFAGLQNGGSDGKDPSVGIYGATTLELDLALLNPVLNGGNLQVRLDIPSSQTIGIDYVMGEALMTPVPESSSTLSFLALGTLGAASTLKRKLKPSKSTENKG